MSDLEFTFGIITNGTNDNMIKQIIDSIKEQNIPKYEIIIVGNTHVLSDNNIIIIPFDEEQKRNWITRKKNIIVQKAAYENIVLMHDYFKLDKDWYSGFKKFGNNFDWCVPKIMNFNGSRYRDYTIFPLWGKHLDKSFNEKCLLPYDFVNTHKTNKYLYISGGVYIIKKKIALENLLDEKYTWGNGEDINLTERLNKKNYLISCNQYSIVHMMKFKESCNWEKLIDDKQLALLNKA
jgi:hypothetical protein